MVTIECKMSQECVDVCGFFCTRNLPRFDVAEKSEPVPVCVLDAGAHAVEDGDVAALRRHVHAQHVQRGHRRTLIYLHLRVSQLQYSITVSLYSM